MSDFGMYYTINMLRATKWPRKQGLLRKEVIDTLVFDTIIKNMIGWAASLGSGNPKLALRIIASAYKDRKWDGPDTPQIKVFIDGVRESLKANVNKNPAPYEIIEPAQLAKAFGKSMLAEGINDPRLTTKIEDYFIQGILYGLSNHKEYELWYENHLKENLDMILPFAQKIGMVCEELPSLQQNYINNEEIITLYEHEVGPLPDFSSLPLKLISEVRAIGVKV
jgi:hypothetical protein